MNNKKKDKVNNFLFFLGKGLWKSIPVLGSIIEEVFYEQFKEELTKKVDDLSDDQIQSIIEHIPQQENLENLDKHLGKITEDVKLLRVGIFSDLLTNLEHFSGNFKSIEEKIEPIPNILDVLQEILTKVDNQDVKQILFDEMRKKRNTWIKRISTNQIKLLNSIPLDFISIDVIWKTCQKIIPDCGYKEFRFRLHEFEWLGLVGRYWDKSNDKWYYKRMPENI